MGWGLEHNPSEKFGLCDRLLQLFFLTGWWMCQSSPHDKR